ETEIFADEGIAGFAVGEGRIHRGIPSAVRDVGRQSEGDALIEGSHDPRADAPAGWLMPEFVEAAADHAIAVSDDLRMELLNVRRRRQRGPQRLSGRGRP